MVGGVEQLNLGCGDFYQEGWFNIECNTQLKADLHLDIRDGLPFDDSSVSTVYCGHVLEHLNASDLAGVLREIARVLKPSGHLWVVGPDYDRAISRNEPEQILAAIRGGEGRWDGDSHQWTATAENTRQALEPFFDVVEVDIMDTQGWPVVSRIGWQCAFDCQAIAAS